MVDPRPVPDQYPDGRTAFGQVFWNYVQVWTEFGQLSENM